MGYDSRGGRGINNREVPANLLKNQNNTSYTTA